MFLTAGKSCRMTCTHLQHQGQPQTKQSSGVSSNTGYIGQQSRYRRADLADMDKTLVSHGLS